MATGRRAEKEDAIGSFDGEHSFRKQNTHFRGPLFPTASHKTNLNDEKGFLSDNPKGL